MLLVLSKASCCPWTPLLLQCSHDCTTSSFSRVNGTMIKPIPFSLMKKNHDIYHSWTRNSLSGLTCLHLLEVREQSGSSPVCSKRAHIHLSAWDAKRSSPNTWPSVPFRDVSLLWERGHMQTRARVHMCTHTAKHYFQGLFPGILQKRWSHASPIKTL